MKKQLLCIFLFFVTLGFGQITQYNHFPTMRPSHILDEKLNSISFALSLRVLESDYNGPIIRLRRSSDNAEQDFGWGDNDIVDVAAIDAWRGAANVFVVTWYDQSGLGRNAVQNTAAFQPRFITDPTRPYFFGDGTNDRLDINTSIQILTNAGINGSVLTVLFTTSNNQFTFGTRQPGVNANRWSTHANWNNNLIYFDSGICCDGVRSAGNANNQWQQLSFIRANVVQTIRRDGTVIRTGNYTNGRCTATNGFGILYSNGNNSQFATNRFTELIMYSTDISSTDIQEIEEDQINFWNL
ncbi:arabinofuranosidase catalytic domain-containing protein [Aquimarina sp. 2201CG5-10]|uniref:arabinofuranosidase catalytic domain-containing protein n=1 Tax=Aquimarina callyspongiae TaxID=3098150 RepID=UPI002AB52541|nr:arabinofuranosidase catalytic domain-containing protein [Aquimarina sp. 2201CG5-10]MDY8135606.1 arabinofuranosidase catalytic domain-containing protein [Aquimarina sp. 2201CG5-10]